MRVAVLGGTGFIGRALVAELLARGHEVAVSSRSPERVSGLFPAGVSGLAWDGRDHVVLARWLDRGGDAGLVNLAGEGIATGRWTGDKRRRILDSRVLAARAAARAAVCAANPPVALVQASAVGFYGARASLGGELLGENAPAGDDFLALVCAAWEAEAQAAAREGVRLAVARSGLVLGPGGGILQNIMPPFRLFMGGPLGPGGQWLSWIHITDEAGALAWLLENPEASGAYNLCAPEAVTMREFCAALGRAMNRPSWLPVPAWALRLGLGRDMAGQTVLASQRAVPARLVRGGYDFRQPGLDRALTDALAS
ncbi:TIGR01777 family oxidoreductase [Desulfocurvus sp. DL9XJH121]